MSMVELANVGGGTESRRQAHLEVALEIANHGYENKQFVDATEHPPSRKMFQQLSGEYEADERDEE